MPANASVTKSTKGATKPAKRSAATKPARADRIRHPEVESFDLATIMRALGDPVRIEMVRRVDAEGEILCTDLYERLGLPSSTGSYHLRQLREAGVTRSSSAGTKRIVTVRREDLESRFPGLVDVILREAS
jgi:DNA-binding transcriptional ArsR family regulator